MIRAVKKYSYMYVVHIAYLIHLHLNIKYIIKLIRFNLFFLFFIQCCLAEIRNLYEKYLAPLLSANQNNPRTLKIYKILSTVARSFVSLHPEPHRLTPSYDERLEIKMYCCTPRRPPTKMFLPCQCPSLHS